MTHGPTSAITVGSSGTEEPKGFLDSIPKEIRGPVTSFVVSAPVVTAYLYLFGIIYSQNFFEEFAIPLRLLEFSITDYVERSWNALLNVVQSIGLFRPVIFGTLILFATRLRFGQRSLPVLAAVSLLGIVAAAVTWPDDSVFGGTGELWTWFGIVVFTIAVGASFTQRLVGAQYDLLRLSSAYLLGAIALGQVLVIGAGREGFAFACTLDVERYRIPVGTILAPHNLGIGETSKQGDWIQHTGLRIYSRTPAGLLVFEKGKSPRNGMTLVTGDFEMVIKLEHDGVRQPIEPGPGCDQVIGE